MNLDIKLVAQLPRSLEQDRRPLSDALRTKKAEAIEFFYPWGSKPVTADLDRGAIESNDMILAER